MEFLMFWLVTVIGSYAISLKMIFMMIKDLADAGYKLNLNYNNKLNLWSEVDKEDVHNKSFNELIFFIPLVNMLYSFKFVMDYNNSKWNIIDQLRVLNLIENMTVDEKNKYEKNPTAFNAFLLLLDTGEIEIKSNKNINDDKDFDELLKTMSEKYNFNYENLKDAVKFISENEDKDKSARLDVIQKEKIYLNNYKNEILNSINFEENIKILKKTLDEKKEK